MSRTARDEDDAAAVRTSRTEQAIVDATVEAVHHVARQVARNLTERLDADVEVTLRIRRQ